MCTVTYLPQADGWLLTNNRDETPLRATSHLVKDNLGQHTLLYPPDEKVEADSSFGYGPGWPICLLNGGFAKHAHRPRIAIVAAWSFWRQLERKGGNIRSKNRSFQIEPFTLICGTTIVLWNGYGMAVKVTSNTWIVGQIIFGRHLRCTTSNKKKGELGIWKFYIKNEHFPNKLLQFHQSKPFGEAETDFLMDRPGVKPLPLPRWKSDSEKCIFNILTCWKRAHWFQN